MNKEMTACGSYKCQREEQCDDCFLVDHLKECAWCELYDHEERKLEVQNLASDYPIDPPPIHEMLAYIGKKTGFNPATMFSQATEDEGDRHRAGLRRRRACNY